MRRRLELGDIQGNLLAGYPLRAAQHLLVAVGDVQSGRSWLAGLIPKVTLAGQQPKNALNIAVSFSGLKALGAPVEVLSGLPEAFRQGMAARAAVLGDIGPSAPEHWRPGLGTGAVHVVVSLFATDADALAPLVAATRAGIEAEGLAVIHQRRAQKLAGAREHFGFDDGFAQPAIKGVERDVMAYGVPTRRGRWRPVAAGEFLLGQPDEEGYLPPAPPGPLGRNSSYLVYRELDQDVVAFRNFTEGVARSFGCDSDWVGARIIGRWPDGTPLALSPEHPDPEIAGDRGRINNFGYADDPEGLRCPLGAHIRRTNPRDGLRFSAGMTRRHHLVRRGMPYGPPLPKGRSDDGEERGLLFLCFQADIVRQFEFIQSQWCLDGDVFGLGDDHDPLLGNHTGTAKFTVQGAPPRFMFPLPRLVTTRGGEYFLLPSLSGLCALAGID